MFERPQLKSQYHVEIVKEQGVFLVSEAGHAVLTGRLFEMVTPLIDGHRSPDDIVQALQAHVSPAEVYYALTLLENKGYLREGDHTFPDGEAVFWDIQEVAPQTAVHRLAETRVSVTAVGEVSLQPFLALLESLHVRAGREGEIGVVLTDDYLRTELREYNQEYLRSGRPWMLIKPVGTQVLIGPLFLPGRTGCWDCLAQRLRINRVVEVFVQSKQNREQPFAVPHVSTPAIEGIAYGMAATEIAKWIARGDSPHLEGQILSFNVMSWSRQFHKLTRQPQCPVCGDSAVQEGAKPIELQSQKKMFTEDGGHRALTPIETIQKYEHHVSPLTGAVSILKRHPMGNDGVMHVYLAGDNLATPRYNLKHLQKTLRSCSAGKGMTDLQAKASGLCEGLERYSGAFQGTEIRRRAKLKELDGLGIHPNACMRFSDRQYQQREAINSRGVRFYYVPRPFDEEATVEWTPVWSLTHRVHRYLPTAYCYYAYPSPEDDIFCIACSNGNAAGNNIEEAILQGFLELVERDSTSLWWYNRLRRPAVDLDSFDEPYFVAFRDFLRKHNRELWVLDLTSDLAIPVFVAISRRTRRSPEHILMGFGAHLDPRIAVLRAVTELSQMLVSLFRYDTSIDETTETLEDRDLLRWMQTATIANQPYLCPNENAPLRTAGMYPKRWTDDLKDDVLFCQQLIERQGMELLVLDQTRPEIGLPVVKVIVPGLRHFWARFAAGRLYEVPVALGWLREPLGEEQLNPVPIFL